MDEMHAYELQNELDRMNQYSFVVTHFNYLTARKLLVERLDKLNLQILIS